MEANVSKLLQDALENGTLEKALSTPAVVKPAPLPSCPNLSAKALKDSIKNLLEASVAGGTLSLDQAMELRDLIASYNHLKAQMQAEEDALVILDYSKLYEYSPPQRRVDVSDKPVKSSKIDMEPKVAADLEADLQAQEKKADMVC